MLDAINVQRWIVNSFAVAGGAGVGYVLGGWFIRLLGRVFFLRTVPPRLVTFTRWLGMAALGILVYLWVFGNSMAGGLGGGGGWWPFGGKAGQGDNAGAVSQVTEQPKDSPQRKEDPSKLPEQGRTLQIRLLGGSRVVEQRFYQPEGQAQPIDWAELRQLIGKQKAEEPPLHTIEIVLFGDSVDRDNPAVRQLETWAKEQGLMTKLVLPADDHGREPGKQVPPK